MATAKFRIAHVSDLHLAERPGETGVGRRKLEKWRARFAFLLGTFKSNYRPSMTSYHLPYLEALTRSLRGETFYNSEAYDAYIFSGDLATTGLAEDMAVAAAYLHGRPMHQIALRKHLKLPHARTVLAPGNHDRYCSAKLWPVSTEFERGTHFGAEWCIGQPTHSLARSTVNHTVLVKEGAQLGVVSGDFSYTAENSPRSALRYLGGGCVEQGTVDEMKRRTALLRENGIPTIWVAHHAPVKSPGMFLKLENAHLLGDAALDSGVRYILCGHTHKESGFYPAATSRKTTDRVRVICAGSATSFDTDNRSYFELLFSAASGSSSAAVHLAGFRSMNAIRTANRTKHAEYSHRFEFAPKVARSYSL